MNQKNNIHSAPIPLGAVVTFDIEARRELHPNFSDLIAKIRQIGHGEIVVKIADGIPVYIYKVTENIRLGGDE